MCYHSLRSQSAYQQGFDHLLDDKGEPVTGAILPCPWGPSSSSTSQGPSVGSVERARRDCFCFANAILTLELILEIKVLMK